MAIRLISDKSGFSRYVFVCADGGCHSPTGRTLEEAKKSSVLAGWTIDGFDGLCPVCADGGRCIDAGPIENYKAPPPPPPPFLSSGVLARQVTSNRSKGAESRYERECPLCGHKYGKTDKAIRECPDCGVKGEPTLVGK